MGTGIGTGMAFGIRKNGRRRHIVVSLLVWGGDTIIFYTSLHYLRASSSARRESLNSVLLYGISSSDFHVGSKAVMLFMREGIFVDFANPTNPFTIVISCRTRSLSKVFWRFAL